MGRSIKIADATAKLSSGAGPQPKRSSRLRHLLNICFITLAAVAFFWPVFLGRTIIDVANLNNQLPWGYSSGRMSDYPYDRRDETDMYLTRDYFVVQSYRDHEAPLWNPYTMAGHPIYADGVARIFSPFLLFYTFLDMPLGYSIARISELILAAIFMYAFLVGIGVAPRGALMGSLVFEFSSHSMLHLTALGWFGGLMWLPLILLFAYRAVARHSYVNALISGVFLAMQFYCGFLPNQIYYVGAVGLLYLYCWFALRKAPVSRVSDFGFTRAVRMAATTLLAGFGLSATQWLPTFELLRCSNRLIVPTEIGYIYLPPWYAITLVFPHLFGTAYDPEAYHLYSAVNVSHDHILYLGIVALLPIAFLVWRVAAPRFRRRRRQTENARNEAPSAAEQEMSGPARVDGAVSQNLMPGYLALLTATSVVLIMAAPLYVHVTRFLPVLQTIRVIMRASVLFAFGASALAGIGIEALLDASSETLSVFGRYWRRCSFAATGLVVLGVAVSYLIKLSGVQSHAGLHGKLEFLRGAVLQLARQFAPLKLDTVLPVILLLFVGFLIWLVTQQRIGRRSLYWLLIALVLCDLFWNSRGLNPSFDRGQVYPHTQMTDFIRSLPPGRVLVTPSDIDLNVRANPERNKIIAPPNTLLAYGIPVLAGKDQLFPRAYKEYCALAERQQNLSHVVFNTSRSRYLDLLNARYVLTHDYEPPPKDCRLLLNAEGLSLYENMAALPRAFIAENPIRCGSEKEAASAVQSGALTGATNAVVVSQDLLPGEASVSHSVADQPAEPDTVNIVEDRRDIVRVSTDTSRDRMLILSDNYYPGWKAFIDGAPVAIKRANLTMRAVSVPAGRHVVSFVFAPMILRIAIYISILAAVAVLTPLALILIRQRKPGQG